MKTLKGFLTLLVLIPLVGIILPLTSTQQPAEAQTGTETGTIDDLTSGGDTCAEQTVLHDNTGTEDLILQLTHAGTVVHTVTVPAGASDVLPAGDYIPTGASGDFVAELVSTYDSDVIATKTLAGLDCQDGDGDGFTADIDCDDTNANAASSGPLPGWSEINSSIGTGGVIGEGVCGRQLNDFPSSIVYNTPLSQCTAWSFPSPTRLRVSVYLLPIGTGSNAGNYIRNTLNGGAGQHSHTYGMLWAGSQNDHDGNTGVGANNRWRPRGWSGADHYTNNDILIGFDPNGYFGWFDSDAGDQVWRPGRTNAPYLGVAHTWDTMQAAGVEPYLGFMQALADHSVIC